MQIANSILLNLYIFFNLHQKKINEKSFKKI